MENTIPVLGPVYLTGRNLSPLRPSFSFFLGFPALFGAGSCRANRHLYCSGFDPFDYFLVLRRKLVKSFLQGFLPGLTLKIFLFILPKVLMIMSKIEGHVAVSMLERRAAAKYYYFMLVNVFLGSIVTGTAFEQLDAFIHQSPTQ